MMGLYAPIINLNWIRAPLGFTQAGFLLGLRFLRFHLGAVFGQRVNRQNMSSIPNDGRNQAYGYGRAIG
jgi:hypothetical protein